MPNQRLEIDLRRLAIASLIAIVLLAATLLARAEEPSALPDREIAAKELLAMLRAGGYVLYFRHTSTDFGQSDEAMTSFDDCEKQRNLTEKGRDEARAIGVAIKTLTIPIGTILSSPFCRTTETAQLAFDRVEKSIDLRGGPISGDPASYPALRKQLSTWPQPETNTILVGHGNPFRSIAGAPHLSEGEAAVLQPVRDGEYRIIARIRLEEWKNLLDVDPN